MEDYLTKGQREESRILINKELSKLYEGNEYQQIVRVKDVDHCGFNRELVEIEVSILINQYSGFFFEGVKTYALFVLIVRFESIQDLVNKAVTQIQLLYDYAMKISHPSMKEYDEELDAKNEDKS